MKLEALTRDNFSHLPVMPSDGAWGTELMKLGGTVTVARERMPATRFW